ncbi:MAG: class I SAM-dependent methyltransferase [Methanolobus sp.]|jgi:ubiquinone/menaquinone biosynthesis C-methylase UbiE|nr:class I SAM-dependent methyltransferase [Methanolobus sp.]
MSTDEKSHNFQDIAENVFAPIYPVIASHIIDSSGIKKGICLDLGCGIASLGIAIAEQTDLIVYAVDISEKMYELSTEKASRHSVSDRIKSVLADVHKLPFGDGFANLVVSRGSVFFWDDLPVAFREISRVLVFGGEAWIGGGFGTAELRQQINEIMISRDPDWQEDSKKRLSPENKQAIQNACSKTGLPYRVVNDDSGFWVVLNKGESKKEELKCNAIYVS